MKKTIILKHPMPVAPTATVNCPKEPAVVFAASDLMPFVHESSRINPEIEALVALEKKVTILELEVAELKARSVYPQWQFVPYQQYQNPYPPQYPNFPIPPINTQTC